MTKKFSGAIRLGIDDGRAHTKIFGKGVQLKIRTAVRAGMHAGSVGIGGGGTHETGTYQIGDIRYTIGDKVDGEDTRFEGFDGSNINLVAIHHALVSAGFSGKEVRIATGLPVSSFFLSAAPNSELINQKRELIKGAITSLKSEFPVANIVSNMVCSEALSAYFDYVLDENGLYNNSINSEFPVGIVDIGGRTTDCVWVVPPSTIKHDRSGSEPVGVLDLYELVGQHLRSAYKVSAVSIESASRAVSTNLFRMSGKDHDVTEIVSKARQEIEDRIMREINRRFTNIHELDKILFVGGGTAALPGIAEKFQNGILVPEPEFANARGMYKFLMHLDSNA